MSTKSTTTNKHNFIVSDEKNPAVVLKPGMKISVATVQLLDPTLKPAKGIAARLCGGSGTCLALIDISDTDVK